MRFAALVRQGDYRDAFVMYGLEVANKDSLVSKENQKAILKNQFQYVK